MLVESRKKTRDLIANDEGFIGSIYSDNRGHLTIGFGFNLESCEMPISVALEWLNIIINDIEISLSKVINFWENLNDARKYVLINMAYQLGINGLLKFRDMLNKLGSKDYVGAANEMKDSVWYRDYTTRASRLIKIMLYGEF